MRRIRTLLLLLLLSLTGNARAHEVRPAYLQITQRADGRADVLWKLPIRGQLALSLHPRLSPGLLDRTPTSDTAVDDFEVRRWVGLDLGGRGLGGREVRVEGLDRTITDVLLVVRLPGGDQAQQILTPAAPAFTIDAHAGAAVTAYLRLGVEHILTGIDHLLFVFGLMLLTDSLAALLKTITAFTLAHSLTLAATALGVLSVDPRLVEAMVALSILFLAVELVRKQRGELGLSARYPWAIAFTFGLLHGAAFAGALKEVGLPQDNIPLALFLFNVGVELGQIAFVSVVGAAIWAARRITLPPRAPVHARMAASYVIGAFSMFWFLDRASLAFGLTEPVAEVAASASTQPGGDTARAPASDSLD